MNRCILWNCHAKVKFIFFSWSALMHCVCYIFTLTQCVHLRHCAALLLSWPAPPQEDQPERCTWPCAHDDPSCSEPVWVGGTQSRGWNLLRRLILKNINSWPLRTVCLRQIVSTLTGDSPASAEKVQRHGILNRGTRMTILIACNVGGNCPKC